MTTRANGEPQNLPYCPDSAGALPSGTLAVTGRKVNLRAGPGTEFEIDGQVHEGDQLQVTGRNALGTWWRVLHPAVEGKQTWIYAALTHFDATAPTVAPASEGIPPPEAEPPWHLPRTRRRTPISWRVGASLPSAPGITTPAACAWTKRSPVGG